jgi:hypothetical protein
MRSTGRVKRGGLARCRGAAKRADSIRLRRLAPISGDSASTCARGMKQGKAWHDALNWNDQNRAGLPASASGQSRARKRRIVAVTGP